MQVQDCLHDALKVQVEGGPSEAQECGYTV